MNARAPVGSSALCWTVGQSSLTGAHDHNEDRYAHAAPETELVESKGVLLVVADGVSGEGRGREAAEYVVRGLLSGYYATTETWSVLRSLDSVLAALNRWLHAQGGRNRELAGMSSTVSALVLRGNRYYLAHVGDSRVYRLRSGVLEQLTRDHVWERPDMTHVLRRAMGLDDHVVPEFSEGDIEVGDRFLLLTDGVWEPLGYPLLEAACMTFAEPQNLAGHLVGSASRQGGHDDATALVVRIDRLPDRATPDWAAMARALPLPPRLQPETTLDGFRVIGLVHESRSTLVYRVCREQDGSEWALKTLPSGLEHDKSAIEALLQEEWLVGRVVSRHFPGILPQAISARSALYLLTSWHDGASLQQWLDHGRYLTTGEVIRIGSTLLKAVAVLHRLGILHRDLKPANIHVDERGELRILDLGMACHSGFACVATGGTPAYMAPELLSGETASVASDVYAIGVTLYHLLTRRYPYGEIEAFQHPRFGLPVPASRYRPDMPLWFDNCLLRAVSVPADERFESVEEMLVVMESGEHRVLDRPRVMPWLTRRDRRFWRLALGCSVLLNLLLVALVVTGHR